jgi:hypothetical protein
MSAPGSVPLGRGLPYKRHDCLRAPRVGPPGNLFPIPEMDIYRSIIITEHTSLCMNPCVAPVWPRLSVQFYQMNGMTALL